MFQIYLVCAAIGSTVLVLQLALSLFGLVGTEFDFDGELPEEIDVPELDVGDADVADAETGDSESTSTSIFGKLSLRAAFAALAFFGIAGVATMQTGMSPVPSLLIACAVGLGAMYFVTELMRVLYRLDHDGTVDVQNAMGRYGTVYLPVPGERDGTGKVQIRMDDRIMEYEAVTSNPERLCTGSKIVVIDVLGPTLLEVEPDRAVA